MSLSRNQQGKSIYDNGEIEDSEAEYLPLHPNRVSRSSTLENMAKDNNEEDSVARQVLEPCCGSTATNSPSLENRPRIVKRNEVVTNVNIEMNNGSDGLESPSNIKCFGLIKDSGLSQTSSSSNSLCGPSPRKSIRWIFIFVFVWITFMVVINMQKQVLYITNRRIFRIVKY